MKRFKKPLKFYVITFVILSLGIAGYSIYKILVDKTPIEEVSSLWALPIIFIVIYYGSDALLDKMFNKKKEVKEDIFINEIVKRMQDANEFLVEDYRRLQNNQKFQESLKIAYKIFSEGESELYTIDKLSRKFKKDTIESKAIDYVIDYIIETKKPMD
ncbi:MAG: hypothetical protein PHF05_01610 [Candidatus Izemoplasmatales bacterium]|nr:hypothetical protein [Candidatus Izemoplasmatales bacterium]MDY0139839.1 hypothetical protein [Candidatus Izemoplasmatales bacterium]